jgi:ribose-phosphate pyrophosphokinase
VVACCAHGILTDPCAKRVNACDALEQLVVTDSIPQDRNVEHIPKLRVLTVAPLLAAAITKMSCDESLGSLYQAKTSAPISQQNLDVASTCA